jgi:hypothetical protein
MKYSENKLQAIYLEQISEVAKRLESSKIYFENFKNNKKESDFDSSILQLRKAMESLSYASIVPNKTKYQTYRAKADTSHDFTKDFNATKIFYNLSQINKDFYPKPLVPAIKQPDGSWFYDTKKSGFLTQIRFQKIYDRLGKFLHADNPWGKNKQSQNLANDLEATFKQIDCLLELHVAFIRTKNYKGAWVVELLSNTLIPKLIVAKAMGDFSVQTS